MPRLLGPPVSLQNMTQAHAAVSPFLLHLHFTPRLADPHNTALITTLLWCCNAAHTRDQPSSGSVHTVTSVSCCPSPYCHPISLEIATIMRQSYKKVCRKVKSQRERETNMERYNKVKQTKGNREFSQEYSGHWVSWEPRAAQSLVLWASMPVLGQVEDGKSTTPRRSSNKPQRLLLAFAKILLASKDPSR